MLAILIAKKKDGTTINSTKFPKEQLKALRETTTFYCPQCETPVQLKVGDIVIPHFAHATSTSCTASFSEGESEPHLSGKLQLFEFFQAKRVNVKLEPFLKGLAQRPDLLVTTNGEAFPIEFQCSTIPLHQKISRTDGYVSAGMQPIWILRTPKKLTTRSPRVGLFTFTRFEESFFTNTFPQGNVLLTYDPHFKRFHYFSSLLHVAGKKYIGLHRILSIDKQIFPLAHPKIPTEDELKAYLKIYKTERTRFLKSRIFSNYRGINDPFLRACYELRVLPEQLPDWIGVPIAFSPSFREHACEWQLLLIHFMKQQEIGFKQLTTAKIRQFARRFGSPTDLQMEACLSYRNIFLMQGVNEPSIKLHLDEQLMISFLKAPLFAKGSES